MGIGIGKIPIVVFAAINYLTVSVWAVGYTNIYSSASFSWLDQYSFTGGLGGQACVPTSAVNALTYMQNSAPGYFGTNLTGGNYTSWLATGQTLAGPGYLNTTAANGTYLMRLPYALTQYITTDKGFSNVTFSGMFAPNNSWADPYTKPSYITAANPTTSFLIDSFKAGSAVMISIDYNLNGPGHEMTATGLSWVDTNNNNIIDFDENARLYVLDPLDPSVNYSGMDVTGAAKFTDGQVWYDSGINALKFNYLQYSGALPYESGNYTARTGDWIDAAFAVSIPEPSICALLVLSGVGFAYVIRRRAL